MESNTRILEPEVLMPQLLELMKDAETVPLVISGSSMTPFLVHGRDTVYLSKAVHPLKRGDMILYRRSGGRDLSRGGRSRGFAAAAQHAHRGHAHGARSHAFEKVSAGKLFVCHGVSSYV